MVGAGTRVVVTSVLFWCQSLGQLRGTSLGVVVQVVQVVQAV